MNNKIYFWRSYLIRRATKLDIEDIIKLFLLLDKDGSKYQPEHFNIGERTNEYLLEIINIPISDFLLFILDNKIIGFSLLYQKETKGLSFLIPCKYAYLQDFVVKEEYRNHGYGTQLFEASKQWAKDNGMDYLRLSVFPSNDSGIRFYKRHGLIDQMLTMECPL
jgi:ribosomal protein S18 acetylase RimI-like enzyme